MTTGTAPSPHPGRSGWRRWVRSPWAVGAMLVVLIALLGWLVFFSSVLSARKVIVVGADQVTDQEVLDAADVPDGVALARLPLDSIAERVEQLDAVATAQVKREWPDTVRIVLTERQAVAVVAVADGFGVVGSDGTVYRTEPVRPQGLPLLDRLSANAGSIPSVDTGDASIAAFDVAVALPPSLRRTVDAVTARSSQTVTLHLRNGAIVDWGSAIGNQRKTEVLKVLMQRSAARYDVTVPDAPALSN